MIALRRYNQLLIAAAILTAGMMWAGSASALTMTPRPPTVLINGPTAVDVSWSTDSAAGPNHVWYGSGGPEWTEFTGLAAGDIIRDIDVFDSNRAFLVTSTPSNTGRLYVGNRQVGGAYAWNEEMTFAFIPNAVAAQDYDTVWFAGYSATVYSRKIESNANGSFNVTLNAPNVIWALEEVNGTIWVGGTNTVLFSYNTATSGPPVTRITGITSIDPAQTRYTLIDAYDGNTVWAVADMYVSATFNGGSNWVNWNPSTSNFIEDIKAVGPDLAYGVGRNGWTYRLQGSTTSGWTSSKPTSYDLLSLGAGSPTMLMAFGCCSVPAGRDLMMVSYDGLNWSTPEILTTSMTASSADFITPTSGFRGGSGAKVEQYQAIYPRVNTINAVATNHSSSLSAGLREGVTYHASADSYITVSPNVYGNSVESGDFLFKTTGLDINAGPTVTPQTTAATIDWGTAVSADTRAYLSPSIDWRASPGLASTTFYDLNAIGDTAYVIGSFSPTLLRSTDMGATWPSFGALPNYGYGLAMVGNRGWVSGEGFIYRVDGTAITGQTVPSAAYNGIDAFDDQHAIAVGTVVTGPNGIIIRTSDGGANWKTVFTPTEFLRDVAFLDVNTAVAVGDSINVYRTVDGGTTWVPVPANAGGVTLYHLAAVDNQSVIAVGQNGQVVRSIDGGKSWGALFNCAAGQTLYGVAATSMNDVWVGGANGTLIHWTPSTGCQTVIVPSLGANDIRAMAVDGGNVWVAGASGFAARYGINTADAQYKSVLRDSSPTVTSHTTGSITGLTANTTYNYFVQSNAASNASVVSGGTFTTLPIPTLQLSTNSLGFTMTEGAANPADQTFQVQGQANADIGNWTATKVSGGSWLTFNPAAGSSSPGTVTVSVDGTGLTAAGSPYTGSIRIDATAPGVLNTPQIVNVTLTVSPPPILSLSATNLSFTVQAGDPSPAPQGVTVNNTGSGVLTYTTSVGPGSSASWLIISSAGSAPFPTPNQIVVAPSTGALAAGTYNGIITVTGGPGTQNSPQDINVTLNVTAAPTLEVNWPGKPAPITFTATQGGANPAPFTGVSVSNSGGGTMTWTSTSSTGWLSSSPTSDGNGPTAVTVQATTGALGPSGASPYTGTINVNAGAAGTFAIPVEFTVSAAPVLSATPSSMTFTTPQGTNPATQILSVTGGAPAGWSVSVTSGTWLRLPGTNTGTIYPTNVTVGVEVVATGLGVGTYNGSLQVASPGALPATLNITVTLQVTAPPVLQLRPTPPLSPFTTEEGKNPAAQTIQIDNIGGPGTVMNWTINQPAETWVRVTTGPCNGSYAATVVGSNTEGSPATDLNVCVDVIQPTLLTSGSYTSSFVVAAPGAFSQPQTVNVQLNVTPDSTGPTVTAGSISITTGFDCSVTPADVFANIRWTTSEYGDSQVDYGETTTGGVPDYELFSIVRDAVDVTNHTGGVLTHDVLLDNLAGGHRYYVRFRSTDRYGNVGAYTDHDPANPALYLTFQAPAACDTAPPTNVVLTVPPGTLYGTVNFNLSAQDESGIDHFEIFEVTQPVVLATVSVPAGACTSLGTTYSCVVTYGFTTNVLVDGNHQLYIKAFDQVGNSADSPPVDVQISNSVPTVSNITATPSNVGGIWQAVITWDTDKPSNSRVDYGMETLGTPFVAPADYNMSVTVDDSGCNDCTSGANAHRVTLPNLVGGQLYHFQITSCDPNNPVLCGH